MLEDIHGVESKTRPLIYFNKDGMTAEVFVDSETFYMGERRVGRSQKHCRILPGPFTQAQAMDAIKDFGNGKHELETVIKNIFKN